MTLSDQITFIDDLIRENPDITIREYLEAVQEIDSIEKTKTDMGSRKGIPNLSDEQKVSVLAMAQAYNAKQIADSLGLSLNQVYKICAKVKGGIKAVRYPETEPVRPMPMSDVKKEIVRPAATYSNHSPFGIAS